MKTVTIGFAGAGFSASLHAEALRQVRGIAVRFGGVAATRPERARAFAERHHVAQCFLTVADLIEDPGIDVVCVCVPNTSHAEVAIAAARAGKHVICEKPLTGAFGDFTGLDGVARAHAEREQVRGTCAAIEEAVATSGVLFLYAENWVYAPAVSKTKRLLEASGGPIIDMRAEESHSGSHALRSRRRSTAGGGALLMQGSHAIGAILHLKDFEGRLAGGPIRPVAVSAEIAALYDTDVVRQSGHDWLVSDWEDVETWSNLVISFADGTKAVVTASFAMLGGIRNIFEVYTTNAVFHGNMTPNNALMVYSPDARAFGDEYLQEKIETRAGWISAAPDEDWERGYPQEMQDFMEAVAGGRQPVSGLDLARSVVDVIYAGYQSAAEGRRIALG